VVAWAKGTQYAIDIDLNRKRRGRCCHSIRSKAVDGGLDQDIRKREHHALNTGWQSDRYDVLQQFGIQPESPELQMNDIIGADQRQ
jgi:hypothetical protein